MNAGTLACGVSSTGCDECDKHITEAVLSLEANVDQKYRISDTYVTAINFGIRQCTKHGDVHREERT